VVDAVQHDAPPQYKRPRPWRCPRLRESAELPCEAFKPSWAEQTMSLLADKLIRDLRETQALAKLIGEASPFKKALSRVPAAARSDHTVLIGGETGTGKELVARAIHYSSARAMFPFVGVNCGGLPDTLLEDELFGHERGAFTGAWQRRSGLIAQAEKGTLLLDEVEALSDRGQVVLLRVLQDQMFRPLGASQERQAQVRFLAATNVPLEPRVKAGTFRSDLYYRISVFSIDLPPLRARREDILALAAHFLRKHTPPDRSGLTLSAAANAALLTFDWPGNVRELENAIVRGIGNCQAEAIEVDDLVLPNSVPGGLGPAPDDRTLRPFKALKKLAVEAFEKEYLVRLMSEHRGNVTRAAHGAEKDRRELGRLLKKYSIDPKRFAPAPTASIAR
jgi:transcriptional regulator with PAS, ATPase and Fis domain